MRSILIDWLIGEQNKFFKKTKTLFLTVNLIDRYISNKKILRTNFQLLGVTSLFISCKYQEIYCRHLPDFIFITDDAFTKEQILNMENDILSLLNFELDLPLSIDFYEIICIMYKFTKKEFQYGCFLLEIFLLDMNMNKYLQSEIALAVCYIILAMRDKTNLNIENNNFIKYYSNIYQVNFNIWKNYKKIIECSKLIYYYSENKNKINNKYQEIFKVFHI